eukprot:967386-Prorocentrum_minimum.AAC.1
MGSVMYASVHCRSARSAPGAHTMQYAAVPCISAGRTGRAGSRSCLLTIGGDQSRERRENIPGLLRHLFGVLLVHAPRNFVLGCRVPHQHGLGGVPDGGFARREPVVSPAVLHRPVEERALPQQLRVAHLAPLVAEHHRQAVVRLRQQGVGEVRQPLRVRLAVHVVALHLHGRAAQYE